MSGSAAATSPNDALVYAKAPATITDAKGNKWTIKDGVVYENGAPAGYSAHVTELAFVGGAILQENSSGLWWYWDGEAWFGGLNFSPFMPSPNDATVLAGSIAAITDAAGKQWTITAGKQVAVNGNLAGYSANVVEIADVNGTIWQENNKGLWWSYKGNGWVGNGTSVSPLPVSDAIDMTVNGETFTVPVTTPGLKTVDGTVFDVTARGVATIFAGSGSVGMQFLPGVSATVFGGSGSETISGGSGNNLFIAGSGPMRITGGMGSDVYYMGDVAGARMTITDFSAAKGDELVADSSLASIDTKILPDGHGGIEYNFGSTDGMIDVLHEAFPTNPRVIYS